MSNNLAGRVILRQLLMAGLWAQLLTAVAAAQMFGARTLGQSLTQQPSPGSSGSSAASSGSPVSGNPNANLLSSLESGMARFMRGNRDPNSFVGRGRGDGGFTGSNQADNEGPIQSATGDLKAQLAPNVNRALMEPATSRPGPYRPRITLGFTVTRSEPRRQVSALSRRLERELSGRLGSSLVVTLAGRTAILEGVVATEYDRALAAQLILLEPGVSDVENRLQVADPFGRHPAGPSPGPTASQQPPQLAGQPR